jgi:hypothetical protein
VRLPSSAAAFRASSVVGGHALRLARLTPSHCESTKLQADGLQSPDSRSPGRRMSGECARMPFSVSGRVNLPSASTSRVKSSIGHLFDPVSQEPPLFPQILRSRGYISKACATSALHRYSGVVREAPAVGGI